MDRGRSFRYIKDGEVRWISAGIFENVRDRRMAEYFPLFGSMLHDPKVLQNIITKYRLDEISLESLAFSVRTTQCMESAHIETLGQVLMMHPFQLLRIRLLGRKSINELCGEAKAVLRIKVKRWEPNLHFRWRQPAR